MCIKRTREYDFDLLNCDTNRHCGTKNHRYAVTCSFSLQCILPMHWKLEMARICSDRSNRIFSIKMITVPFEKKKNSPLGIELGVQLSYLVQELSSSTYLWNKFMRYGNNSFVGLSCFCILFYSCKSSWFFYFKFKVIFQCANFAGGKFK